VLKIVSFCRLGIPLDVTVFKWTRPDAKAWAPEAAYRNGRYYFYAPVGGDKIGVAVSSRPDGGFADARADALVDKARDANAGDEPIDPAVFVDKQGQAYMYFGARVPKVFRLKADMVSLDGAIQDVVLLGRRQRQRLAELALDHRANQRQGPQSEFEFELLRRVLTDVLCQPGHFLFGYFRRPPRNRLGRQSVLSTTG
jgi:hypothetical protein